MNKEELLGLKGGYKPGDVLYCKDGLLGCIVEIKYCAAYEVSCGSNFTFDDSCIESTCGSNFTSSCSNKQK